MLTFKSFKDLLRVVNLMNGLLRTPKLDKFNRLIGYLNSKLSMEQQIEIKLVDDSPLNSNA